MTVDEFNIFWSYHASGFVGLGSWLATVTAGENAPTALDIKKRWGAVLREVSLEDAKRASDKLLSGEAEEPTYRGNSEFSKHPAAIRRIVTGFQVDNRRPFEKPRYVNGEQVFCCPNCCDTGYRYAFHPASIQAIVEGDTSRPVMKCGLACRCEAGDQYRRSMPTFSDKWIEFFPRESPEHERQDLIEALKQRGIINIQRKIAWS